MEILRSTKEREREREGGRMRDLIGDFFLRKERESNSDSTHNRFIIFNRPFDMKMRKKRMGCNETDR